MFLKIIVSFILLSNICNSLQSKKKNCQSKNGFEIKYILMQKSGFKTYENIRLYGHFKNIILFNKETNHFKCRDECIGHRNCEAFTIIENMCYLYDINCVHNCVSEEIGTKIYSRIAILNNFGKLD